MLPCCPACGLTAVLAGSILTTGDTKGPVVKLKAGAVEGIAVGAAGEWKGIPFAKPPVSDLRWRPPRSPEPWSPATLRATKMRHNCYQAGTADWYPTALSTQSEDCLYLNVYAPLQKPRKLVPVMLWIYGGGYQGGGANESRLNGTWDVALTNSELVVVTFNYRLNVFGFAAGHQLRSRDPAGGTGNYGILDQRLAMQWVQDNIAAFGGDPNRVFIVGQSAGAGSVVNHLVRRKSWGLFSAAGVESGAFFSDGMVNETKFQRLLANTNCSDVACLVDVPAGGLLAVGTHDESWNPIIDGVDLFDKGEKLAEQGELAPVPVLVGSVMEDISSLENQFVYMHRVVARTIAIY